MFYSGPGPQSQCFFGDGKAQIFVRTNSYTHDVRVIIRRQTHTLDFYLDLFHFFCFCHKKLFGAGLVVTHVQNPMIKKTKSLSMVGHKIFIAFCCCFFSPKTYPYNQTCVCVYQRDDTGFAA